MIQANITLPIDIPIAHPNGFTTIQMTRAKSAQMNNVVLRYVTNVRYALIVSSDAVCDSMTLGISVFLIHRVGYIPKNQNASIRYIRDADVIGDENQSCELAPSVNKK